MKPKRLQKLNDKDHHCRAIAKLHQLQALCVDWPLVHMAATICNLLYPTVGPDTDSPVELANGLYPLTVPPNANLNACDEQY